jgi:hypothetical protein
MSSFRFAMPLLVVGIACSAPNGKELFAQHGIVSAPAGGDAGGSAGSSAGTSSAGSQTETGGTNDSSLAAAAGAGASESGGSGGGSSTGGTSGGGGSGGSGGLVQQPPAGCEAYEGAVANADNGHCYRVDTSELTFAGARDACAAVGGHLVTISDEAEDTFVHTLHDTAHWLGATDGRDNGVSGVGTYMWVDGEPWDYTNWDDGQPNAVATNCPNENSGSHCFEHCGYQTDTGHWIDRACWHVIPSLCEWELPDPAIK